MSSLKLGSYIIDTPIYEILQLLKFEFKPQKLSIIKQRENEIQVTCPFHANGQEAHPSCCIYCGESTDDLKYGTFHCFTCSKSGMLWDFIAESVNISDTEAKEWLISHFGRLFSETYLELQPIELNSLEEKKTANNTKNLEEQLELFSSYHPYMTKRKLSDNIIKKFKLKYDPMTQSIVFPVWDEDGNLILFTRRSVNSKQFLVDKHGKKPIYLYNYLKKYNVPYAFCCESQINALYLQSLGFAAIATFGCGINKDQFDILNHSCIRHFIMAFDGDSAGRTGVYNFKKNIRKDVFVDVLKLPDFKDVNDLSAEDISKLIRDCGLDPENLKQIYKNCIGEIDAFN